PPRHALGPDPGGSRLGQSPGVVPVRVPRVHLRGPRAATRDSRAGLSRAPGPGRGRGRGDRDRAASPEHPTAPGRHRGAFRRAGGAAGGRGHATGHGPRAVTAGRLAVVGAGAWGTALAVQATRAGFAPRLWVYEPELLEILRSSSENPWFLPGVPLPRT